MVAVGELVIPAGYTEVAFVHTQNDTLRPAICTIGAHTTDATELSAIANAWTVNVMPQVNNSWTYTQFRASVQAGLIFQQDEDEVGGGGGAGLVPNTAYLIRKRVPAPGRGHHGRMYLPGCDEPSVDADGRVLAAKVTGLNNAMDSFLGDVNAIPVDLVLLHTEPAPPRVVLAPDVISALVCQTLVATQRRRLRK